MMSQPNILFVQVDQLQASVLRAYGGQTCLTPSIDALAENGIVFENAYCNFPLCAPSRFSMAAGQLCSDIDAFDNAAEFAAQIPTYAHHLRRLGYQTALSGKMHFIGPDQFHGFERRLTADLYPADFSWVPNWGNEGDRDTNDARAVTVSGICERSRQIDFDEHVTHEAVEHLYDMARSSDDRPFFLQVSFTHPHEPYLCRPEYWHLYDDVEIPVPETLALSDEEHDAHAIRLLRDFSMLGVNFSEQDIMRARRAYYGSVSYIDALVKRLTTALGATGFADNTVIVFTSDHGDMLGERGLWFKKHFYENSIRVPLWIHAPWLKAQRISELVSLVDLLPTFNGLALNATWSNNDGSNLEGSDLTALFDQTNQDSQRTVYAEYLAESTLAPLFMVRRGSYKFISSSQDEDLLFDVAADPRERNNLCSDPAHQPLLASFQAEVDVKWDEAALTTRIITSQQQRAFVLASQRVGTPIRWNHGEHPQQPVRWYRGDSSYNDWAFNYMSVDE